MSIVNIVIFCICAMLVMAGHSKVKEWRGIMPLRSTRADVERVLGAPTNPGGSIYRTDNENVFIWYSGEPCKKGAALWDVPRDTVLSIAVYPRVELDIADVRLDEDKYKKEPNPHRQGIIYYIDEGEGVRIETFEGNVRSITYTPAAKDTHLRCPGAPATSGNDENIPPPRKFDEYSDSPFSDEKARLDNLAIFLHQEPEMKGYIIAYAGRRSRAGEAQARAERAKKYVVNERGIERGRIVTIDGGHREDLEVELYALPLSVSAPIPTPTVDRSKVQIIKSAGAKKNRRSNRPRRQP
jgi:hypothetical protein